jgi:hypothetical protein
MALYILLRVEGLGFTVSGCGFRVWVNRIVLYNLLHQAPLEFFI